MGRIKPRKVKKKKGLGGLIKAGATAVIARKATTVAKRLKPLGKAAIGLAKKHPLLTAGAAIIGGIALAKGLKKGIREVPIKRRKALVPKTVKKWVGKMVRRRKGEDKILRKLISHSGIKRIVRTAPSSVGVITASEAKQALRK